MASFKKWNCPEQFSKGKELVRANYGFSLDDAYLVSGVLTEEDVEKINSFNRELLLIFDNTKDIKPDMLKKISDKVTISIKGGLDYIEKTKYQKYYERYFNDTLYKPLELIPIIEYFEKIESKIKPNWTDTQKSLYIFKTLARNLHYRYKNESKTENGKSVIDCLRGLLYGKLICAGFSLVFKETMDRINVPCFYQMSHKSCHAWNIVILDGKPRGIELTGACSNKDENGGISPDFFGASPNFYDDPHHDLTDEPEEEKFELVPFTDDEIYENNEIININDVYEDLKKGKRDKLDDFIEYASATSFLDNLEIDLKNRYISQDDITIIINNIKKLYNLDEINNIFGEKLDIMFKKYCQFQADDIKVVSVEDFIESLQQESKKQQVEQSREIDEEKDKYEEEKARILRARFSEEAKKRLLQELEEEYNLSENSQRRR